MANILSFTTITPFLRHFIWRLLHMQRTKVGFSCQYSHKEVKPVNYWAPLDRFISFR